MENNVWLALLRHLLTLAGGSLVTQGLISATDMQQLIGAVLAAIGTGWSIYVKVQAGKASGTAPAAAAPPAAPLLLLLLLPLAACAEQPATAALTPANVECAAEVARAVVAHASADGETDAQKAVGSATALLSPACVAAAAAAVARE